MTSIIDQITGLMQAMDMNAELIERMQKVLQKYEPKDQVEVLKVLIFQTELFTKFQKEDAQFLQKLLLTVSEENEDEKEEEKVQELEASLSTL